MESLDPEDYRMKMPVVEAAYLLNYFHATGMVVSSGMGLSPISWTELRNYCLLNNLDFSPWEVEQIMMMSRSYSNMLRKAEEVGTPPPFTCEETEEEITMRRERVIAQMKALKESRNKAP